jgi:hypothetical protein
MNLKEPLKRFANTCDKAYNNPNARWFMAESLRKGTRLLVRK